MKTSQRNAGVLLPIFSLPSPFGIGDFGSEVRTFADFLQRSGQTYWQLLPLNPVTSGSGYSPYSSISSIACNTLYISPYLLAEQGLLERKILADHHLPAGQHVDYTNAEQTKTALYSEAYNTFIKNGSEQLRRAFDAFCSKENQWLDDFALYTAIKEQQDDKPWYAWPDAYKKRDHATLEHFQNDNKDNINKIKWLQFIAAGQWHKAKTYCNSKGIQIFGDLPFYVSYDSADVWAQPHLFKTDEDGNMTGIAGVPPDYFSETGQLWGMPIYNWDKMKADNYSWWVMRLKKNMELFDVLRLDHFRAFESYWEVPAGAENAVNGQWLKGPGMDFFNAMKEALGGLPFIAEDLGFNMEEVYKLRDELAMPGMKVLQFAWGDNMPVSIDIPHNYPVNCIVYTGTHDNNTVKGWYQNEINDIIRQHLPQYTGIDVHEANIHEVMGRLAYASVARTAILPIQDILGLDADARINTPGTPTGNWQWRLSFDVLTLQAEQRLSEWVTIYNRS